MKVLNVKLKDELYEPHENGSRFVVTDESEIDILMRHFDVEGYTPGDYSEVILLLMPNGHIDEMWAVPTITDCPDSAECIWPPEKVYEVAQ